MLLLYSKNVLQSSITRHLITLPHKCPIISMSRLITKLLISNRGEIACRIIKTAKRMGISTVAVYSDADLSSLHTALADEAIHIGPAVSSESYLNESRILRAAELTRAEAIHPGYGFLSENADFAESCARNKVTFVGPPASAIRSMGSKSESKTLMCRAGVPIVPGYHGTNQEPAHLEEQAKQIGFPVLIKAVMGGGGKGMKVAESASSFGSQLQSAKSESWNSFKDERVILEKYITNPRHIEIQIFTDSQGNAVHLYERDCSLQRRHQKVIEEAPSSLPEAQVQLMGECAKQAALAVDYIGAGTVEFIFDNDTKEFYFMEMNTRLQVEHPITENLIGVDLVEWQLRVASGFTLPLSQEQIKKTGHSIEARIYAEDPENGFIPSPGKLLHMRTPPPSASVRIDSGVREGDEVTMYYDPLIAKLIVKAPSRDEAVNLLRLSLRQYEVCGLRTNIPFLRRVLDNEDFLRFEYDTNFIQRHQDSLLKRPEARKKDLAGAAVCLVLRESGHKAQELLQGSNPWMSLKNFRLNHKLQKTLTLVTDVGHEIELECEGDHFAVQVQGETFSFTALSAGNNEFTVLTNTGKETWKLVQTAEGQFTVINELRDAHDLRILRQQLSSAQDDESPSITAGVPGKITSVFVVPGQSVEKGETLAAMESMKLEILLRSTIKGRVSEVYKGKQDLVSAGDLIILLESNDSN